MKMIRATLALLTISTSSMMGAALSFDYNLGAQTKGTAFDGNVGGNPVAGLSATAFFSLVSVNVAKTTWTFDVTVTETGSLDARVSALGFVDINPDATGITVDNAGNTSWNFVSGGAFPNSFGSLEGCLISNNNNCNGGGGDGVENGTSDTVRIILNFANATNTVTFNSLGVRYQSISGTSGGVTFRGDSGTGRDIGDDPLIPGNEVPEPGTYALLGGSLLGLALLKRRA